ncbi:MAG: GTPase ObgE [Anaerolineales bacterium]
MPFIDETRIKVEAGKGGDGIVHFRREKYVPFGGPDGGDGGKGGDVVLEVLPTLNTLTKLRFQRNFKAENGSKGGGNNKTGKSAEELVINVPPGTMIYDDETNELLGDLVIDKERLVVCKGGRGGRGNARFATAKNQAPRVAERGEPGETRNLRLELKLLADIGIIGVPNAGKSTFLAAVTQPKPKIADYPFTTLEPNLGVVNLEDDFALVLADIPGLIEDAHKGAGLGHAFLRHIQRTRVLIHLLDGMAEDPLADYTQTNSELALFDPGLVKKPQLVALNKLDLPEVAHRWNELEAIFEKNDVGKHFPVTAISALTGKNVRPLLYRAAELLVQEKAKANHQPISENIPIYRPEADPNEFEIRRIPKGWRIQGEAIERAAAMTYWEYDQSVRRFHNILVKLGIDQALRERGVQTGDTVFISDYELEWQD